MRIKENQLTKITTKYRLRLMDKYHRISPIFVEVTRTEYVTRFEINRANR